MARQPAPQLATQFHPISQVALELKIRSENGAPITPERALEMAAIIDGHLEAITAAIIKARNALTYGADYDPLNA